VQRTSGADCVNRPPWVNVALFTLSQRPVYCLALAAVLLTVWWNQADFYVCKRFPDRPERNESLLIAITFFSLLFLLFLLTRIQVRRGLSPFAERHSRVRSILSNAISSPFPGFKPFIQKFVSLLKRVAQQPFSVPVIRGDSRAMLHEVAGHSDGLSRRYVTWLNDSGSIWTVWPSAAWLPLWAAFLAFPPLHSGLMEYISYLSRRTPPSLDMKSEAKADDVVFAIISVAEQGDQPPVVTGVAFQDGKWRRPSDSKVETGTNLFLIFHVGDYPHVHRRIEIVGCSSRNCSVPAKRTPPDPRWAGSCFFPELRRAKACFQYWQPNVAIRPRPPLNIRGDLVTFWGHTLGSVEID
jgi:hypothetical protein